MSGRGQDSWLPDVIQPIYDLQHGSQPERCSCGSTEPQSQFGGAAVCPQLGNGLAGRSNDGALPRDLFDTGKMPFTELLALANMHPVRENHCPAAVAGSFTPPLTPQIASKLFQPRSYANEVHHPVETYDLNWPPAFAPITPEKVTREHSTGASEVENLVDSSYCFNRTKEQNQQENGLVDICIDFGSPPQRNLEIQKPVTESSLAAGPSENNPDAVLLTETPQPKQRRKKHRPKVITEGKPRKRKPADQKASSPQDKPTGKRKYVRKNTPNKDLATPSADTNGENVQRKRKYVRKKEVSKDSTATTTEETGVGPSDVEVLEPNKKSCRRVLNFDMDEVPAKGSSAINLLSSLGPQNLPKQQNGSITTTGRPDVFEMRAQTVHVGILCSQIGSQNQFPADSSLLPEQAPRTPLPKKNNCQPGGLTAPSQKQKCTQIYKTTSIDGQENFNCSTSSSFEEKNASELTLHNLSTSEQENVSRTNLYGSLYNNLLAYRAALHLAPIQKRKRSEKMPTTAASSASSLTAIGSFVSQDPYFIYNRTSAHGSEVSRAQMNIGVTERKDSHGKLQAHVLEPADSMRKKRSKGNTRVRDNLDSLNIVTKSNRTQTGGNGDKETFCTHMEALLAGMDTKLAKKKRTKKSPINPASCSHDIQRQHIVISNQNGFDSKLIGHPKVMWQSLFSIEAIVEKFRHLHISKEAGTTQYQQNNALVPYSMGRENYALVPYRGDGAIIPLDPVKKQRPRPKVDLDEETNRVWKLLMGNINSEGIDGTDEEKAKWWEEERRVFRGRADSFIARMHLVQGDRRFSPWKGSVVDSVVGVFLTQNVSDHLSSSAFMSVAAHFPLKSNGKGRYCEEAKDLAALGQDYYVSDPEETSKWNENESMRQIGDQSSMTLHSSGHSEEREVVDSNESSVHGINSSGSIYESRQELLHSSRSCFDMYSHYQQKGSIIDKTAQGTEFLRRDEAIEEVLSSQNSVISSQDSIDFPIVQTVERPGYYTQSNSEREEQLMGSKISVSNESTFVGLLQMAGSNMLHDVYVHEAYRSHIIEENSCKKSQYLKIGASEGPTCLLSGKGILSTADNADPDVNSEAELLEMFKEQIRSREISNTKDVNSMKQRSPVTEESVCQSVDQTDSTISIPEAPSSVNNQLTESIHQNKNMNTKGKSQLLGFSGHIVESSAQTQNMKSKSKKAEKTKKVSIEWDYLRKQAEANGKKRERTERTMDSVDWEAVRCADVDEIAQTIKERGMNNMLAQRIKEFLNRLVRDHGSIDLEWLRDVPPDKAKEYLLSVRGLGLKSVECVRLLTLHHLAFPVDTNVGRIAVRLGWVPLQPLPESLQLHLLELYPILESIQKYLWPRLCKLDQRTLYELHYQMITFGKVFCTKSKPNCNACPMRGECRHFASAFASARLALPGPEEKGITIANENKTFDQNHAIKNPQPLLLPQLTKQPEGNQQLQARFGVANCEPIIEEPATPEPECTQAQEIDIEDTFCVDDEIPKIHLNVEQLSQNLQAYVENNMELQESDLSKALVALTAEAASIPAPKLKNVSRLRTEHHVYELPDSHPLLNGLDKREADDPCKYLLAIWTPGETADSIQPPEKSCSSHEHGILCGEDTCFSCNSKREAESQIVRGTLLIPCRTAMRGSFPLNGTYFQVNEVFADHESSLNPIDVPRNWLWNLPRRTVYFGTSIPTIFKGLTTEGIQHCFWRGFVCVRGFDQKTRAPRPLMARLHFPASKLAKGRGRGRADEE